MSRSALVLALLLLGACERQVFAASQPSDVWQRIGFDERLNGQVPLELGFRDEHGQRVRLGRYFGATPVVLVLGYYGCKNLCSVVMESLLSTLRQLSFDAGGEFDVVAVSIDPHETPGIARMKEAVYLHRYQRAGAAQGLHFLTGDQAAIRRLARAVGFHYFYDDRIQQFVHAAGLMVLTPAGKIARYFYGVQYPPRDLRLGLIEASRNQIGSVVDRLLLLCADYNPANGRYEFVIWNVLRAACAGTVAALGAFILVAMRREQRKAVHQPRRSS
jgi:protein SCO1/2